MPSVRTYSELHYFIIAMCTLPGEKRIAVIVKGHLTGGEQNCLCRDDASRATFDSTVAAPESSDGISEN